MQGEPSRSFEDSAISSKRFRRTLRLGVLFALVLSLGFAGGLSVGAAGGSRIISSLPLIGDGLNATPDPSLDFTEFWKVYNTLNGKFVQTHGSSTLPTLEERMWGAIQGLTDSYGDPYTVFLPPEEAKLFQEEISGNFEGVGMEIGLSPEGVLTVIAPLKGTPAERAGLVPGDLILSIDGKSTEGMTTEAAVKLIRGPKGSTVKFTILREGKPRDISVVRDTIQVPTLDTNFDRDTGIYTIALYEFTGNSVTLFENALADFRSSGSKKLILDLRGNPGGYLDAAVDMSSHFLPRGEIVVTEDYKGKEQNLVHKSTGTGGLPAGTKIVILIDKGSASASEILAGALKDHGLATLIGTRSFGKGSVQELIPVGQGALKVTVARWLTPSGKSISDGGLAPDIEVERTPEDVTAGKDPQMDRAVEFLNTGK
ncbi:MAG: carboxyl-terminal processing protease [Candidatus Parcubacteria bacterium]|jgi:carboxyl-terminal processing protease|nr:carboxyl-terminal processing protease [Candidatus Parcubacteria bacterium]